MRPFRLARLITLCASGLVSLTFVAGAGAAGLTAGTTITLDPATPQGAFLNWYSSVRVIVSATPGVPETRCVLDPASAPATFDDLPASCPFTGVGATIPVNGWHTVYAASKDAGGNAETPVSRTFKVDSTPPNVVPHITGTLGANGWYTTAVTVAWDVTDPVSGIVQDCPPTDISTDTPGTNVTCTATNGAGLQTTSTVPIKVDTTAPDTTVDTNPPDPDTSTSPSFAFHASETPATFECQLDSSAWAACGSQQSYSGLATGLHTFAVRAIDDAGLVDASPAIYTWTIVDLTPPETSIDDSPDNPSTTAGASFTFSANEPATFECKLDGAPFASCASPQSYAVLTPGSHTFAVRAIDLSHNVDPTPAVFSWTNGKVPIARITARPPLLTNDATPSFGFVATDPGATFVCALDGGAFAPCTTGAPTSAPGDGIHTFAVKAVDAAGRESLVVKATWKLDTAAPETKIKKHPSASTGARSATFKVTATDKDAKFECALDTLVFTSCKASPTYKGLSVGAHTFRARAVDAAGNADATPAVFSWTIT